MLRAHTCSILSAFISVIVGIGTKRAPSGVTSTFSAQIALDIQTCLRSDEQVLQVYSHSWVPFSVRFVLLYFGEIIPSID